MSKMEVKGKVEEQNGVGRVADVDILSTGRMSKMEVLV